MQVQQVATRRKRNRLVTALNRPDPPATPERMAKAQGHYELGDDKRGGKILTMRDSPLERARNRRAISDGQYAAATKYYNHWWRAGLSGNPHSLELDRVFGGDNSGFGGMAKTESQAFHRQQYRAAVQLIGALNSSFLEAVVCHERSLAEVGLELKWKHEKSQIVAATERLRVILDMLREEWGFA